MLENDREGADKGVFGVGGGRILELSAANGEASDCLRAKLRSETGLIHHGRSLERANASSCAFLAGCHYVKAGNGAQLMRQVEADSTLSNVVRVVEVVNDGSRGQN